MPAVAKQPDPGRRALLRGTWRRSEPVIRPPWTTDSSIIDECTRCDACVEACPENILTRGDGGFPVVNFLQGSGECTFCGACAGACPEPVFNTDQTRPWLLSLHIDNSRCLPHAGVHCEACRDNCEMAAIRFSPRLGGPAQPQIDNAKCTGCGACISVCPANALSAKPQVKEDA